MASRPWERYGGQTPTPPAIQGPPRQPSPQTDAQAQGDALANRLAELQIAEREREARQAAEQQGRAAQQVRDVRGEITAVINAARRARQRSADGYFQTGFGADWIGGNTPEGRSLRGDLDTIGANAAFNRLQQMRAESPTGGALGSITERELQLLQNTVASLDPGQADADFQRSMDTIINRYTDILNRIPGEGTAQDVRNAVERARDDPREFAAAPPAGSVRFGDESTPPPSGSAWSPEQVRAYDAFMAANPRATAAQIRQFAQSVGIRDVSNADEIVRARDAGAGVRSGSEARLEAPAEAPVGRRGTEAEIQQQMLTDAVSDASPLGGVFRGVRQTFGIDRGDAYRRGVNDVVTLGFADEIGGGIRSALTGVPFSEAVASERALDRYDTENNFGYRLGGQLTGGLFLPGSASSSVGRAAVVNGLYGAGYGAGSGEGPLIDRAPNALTGAIIGAGSGAALQGVGNALTSRFAGRAVPGGDEAIDLARAADAEGVRISRPIVDPASRDRMAYLESAVGSGTPIREGLEQTSDDLEAAVGRLGAGGTVEEYGVMGQRIQDAGQRYIRRSNDVRRRMYDRAERLAGDAPIVGREAINQLDEEIASLSRNAAPNRAEIAYLNDLRSTFVDEAGNPIERRVGDIRELRTGMRGQINERNLTASGAEARVMRVLDAARRDVERDLAAANPAAVRAYQRADRFNAERATEIRQVVQNVIGRRDNPLGGEQVWARIRTLAGPGGDSGRLTRMWGKLSPEEQADAAATLAQAAGRESPDADFSPALFIRFARSLSPAARRVAFGENGAQSIANLRNLSAAYRATERRLNNSRSGVVQNWGAFFKDMLRGGPLGAGAALATGGSAALTGGAGVALGVTSGAIGALSRRMSARSLMNPDMSRWLAAGARETTETGIRDHIAQLSRIAARNPTISQEVTGLQQALLQAANDNALRVTRSVAAENEEQR